MTSPEHVKSLLEKMNIVERRQVASYLRVLLPPHPVEEQLMVSADEILYALSRAGDFTVRMIRGIFAEAAFASGVLPQLAPTWREVEARTLGDPPYDFMVTDQPEGSEATTTPFANVRVQVKMQRSEEGRPLPANRVWRSRVSWPAEYFVVEVQKSRKGEKKGKSTRPYRFGEFDVLAVSLGPSTGKWSEFIYTVERWLLPDPAQPECLLTYQPVPPFDTATWTKSFPEVVSWLRSGTNRQIEGDVPTRGKTPRIRRSAPEE